MACPKGRGCEITVVASTMLPTVTYLVMKPRSRRQRRSEQLEGVLVVVGVVVGAIALAKVMVAARNGIVMPGQMTMAMGFRSVEMLR